MRGSPLYIWFLIWLPVQIVSLAVITFLFTFGLILIPFLVYLLALGVTALVTGLTAVLAGNLLIKDGQRTSMAGVLLRCELVGFILALLLIAAYYGGLNFNPPILSSTISAVILAIVATYAAVTLRVAPEQQSHQWRRALLLLLLALISIPLTIFIASLFGWAGA